MNCGSDAHTSNEEEGENGVWRDNCCGGAAVQLTNPPHEIRPLGRGRDLFATQRRLAKISARCSTPRVTTCHSHETKLALVQPRSQPIVVAVRRRTLMRPKQMKFSQLAARPSPPRPKELENIADEVRSGRMPMPITAGCTARRAPPDGPRGRWPTPNGLTKRRKRAFKSAREK